MAVGGSAFCRMEDAMLNVYDTVLLGLLVVEVLFHLWAR